MDLRWPERPYSLEGCAELPTGGGPSAEDFAALTTADLRKAAEALGMNCETEESGATCKLYVEYEWMKGTPRAVEEARTLVLHLPDGASPAIALIGKGVSAR